jgi:type VI protein secretion system component Hcp
VLVGAILVGMLATVVGVGRVRATAAPTGWSYAVQLATPSGTFTMQHITSAVIEGHARAVSDSMTLSDLAKAKTALGAKPRFRLHITKTFGDAERANDVASLAGTVLPRVGYYAYYNGVLVDHLRLAPAWVTYVHQATPNKGVGAIQETMEFSSNVIARLVSTAQAPVVPPKPIDGLNENATFNDPSAKEKEWIKVADATDKDSKDLETKLTSDQQTQAASDLGADPVWSVTLTKQWSQVDNTSFLLGQYEKDVTSLVLRTTKTVNGTTTPYLERSIDKAFISAITWTYPTPGSTDTILEKVSLVTNQVKRTYVSPSA